jgi:hypothetical protein
LEDRIKNWNTEYDPMQEARKQLKLKEKYGSLNWYNWQVANWGCKWDASSTDFILISDTELNITFDTPWCPPDGFLYHLMDLGFEVDLSAMEAGMDYWLWRINDEEIEGGTMSDYIVYENEEDYSVDEAATYKKALEIGISKEAFDRCQLDCIRGG